MKKYELTDESITFMGHRLFRIRAIRSFNRVAVGTLGGFIEKEENLSHDNDAWIYNNAYIFGNARICDDAHICDKACVFGDARIYDDAHIYGDACICDNAHIYGDARIYGNACIYDDAHIYGDARISGDARIYDDACISGDADYLYLKGLGSENRNTTFFKCEDGHIHVSCGCFSGNLSEFENKVKETHGDSKYAKEYLACIEVVKIHFEEE